VLSRGFAASAHEVGCWLGLLCAASRDEWETILVGRLACGLLAARLDVAAAAYFFFFFFSFSFFFFFFF
jgi:hypothetical protein